jgi:hypothetical protein
MGREFLVTALEAAEHLGITFNRFKVAIWRGMGLDPKRRPNGAEAKPVVGGWSARSAKYRASEIKRMHEQFPFRSNRTPDYRWFRLVSAPKPSMARRPIPTPVSRGSIFTATALTSSPAQTARRPESVSDRRPRTPKPNQGVDWLF